MQRLKTVYFLTIVSMLVLCSACGQYNKLMKSSDVEWVYEKAQEYFHRGKYQRAAPLFAMVQRASIGTAREDTIAYYTGLSYYRMGDFETSGELFDNFRRIYSRSPFLEDVEFMYAMGYYYSSPPPTKDQSTTIMAITSLSEYLSRYPNGAKYQEAVDYIMELQDKIREKEYLNAYTYYKIGQYRAAVITFRNALDKFPDSKRREEMMYLTVKSAFLLAENSVENMQMDRFLTTMDYYYTFLSEYPESQYLRELDRMQERSRRFVSGNNAAGDTVTGDNSAAVETTIITEQ